METYLNELKTSLNHSFKIIRIDADENNYLFQKFALEAIPTLLLYKNKKVVWSHTGYIRKDELITKLNTF